MKTAEQINAQGNQDTGYRPNQPAEVQPNPEYHQNPWADQVRAELDGKTPAKEGHKIVENLKVITFGEPGTNNLVNLRDGYPSDFMQIGFGDPKQVPILGRVGPGTLISHAMEVNGRFQGKNGPWYAMKLSDIKGLVTGLDGHPLQDLNPEQIVAISGSYVVSAPPPATNTTS